MHRDALLLSHAHKSCKDVQGLDCTRKIIEIKNWTGFKDWTRFNEDPDRILRTGLHLIKNRTGFVKDWTGLILTRPAKKL